MSEVDETRNSTTALIGKQREFCQGAYRLLSRRLRKQPLWDPL